MSSQPQSHAGPLYAPALQAATLVLIVIVIASVACRSCPPQHATPLPLRPRSLGGDRAPPGTFAGAAHTLQDVLRHSGPCHAGHVPVLLAGRVTAYAGPTARHACGSAAIDRPTPATLSNLRALELSASGGCPHRAGWYVVSAVSACPAALSLRDGALRTAEVLMTITRESFSPCADPWTCQWNCASERENFARGPAEGFSPDAPGACAGCSPGRQKDALAALIELEALQVAAGVV